jgi:hypothetical protein
MSSRRRSKSYPVIGIEDALHSAAKIFSAEGLNATSNEVLAGHLGYSGLNGRAKRILSSLRQYGILHDSDGQQQLSDDALAVLEHPRSDPRHCTAVSSLAFTPSVFSMLREEYAAGLPSSASLRMRLMKEGYLQDAADEIIKHYTHALSVVDEACRQSSRGAEETVELTVPREASGEEVHHPANTTPGSTMGKSKGVGFNEQLRFRIGSNVWADITFSGPINQADLRRLQKQIEVITETYEEAGS